MGERADQILNKARECVRKQRLNDAISTLQPLYTGQPNLLGNDDYQLVVDNYQRMVEYMQKGFRDLGYEIGPAEACVTPVHLYCGVDQAANIAVDLRENYNIFCSIVTYPVIPPGMLIFRIIPTAAHSMEDVERTLAAFRDIKERLARGEYDKPMPDMALIK